MGDSFFFQAFVYLGAAVISVPIAKRIGLGSVLGYLIAGVAIGPYVFAFVGHEGQDVMHFAEFGVVMMLFLIGLELQPALLWKLRSSIIGMGGLQVVVTALAGLGIGMATGLDWKQSLSIGLILAMSSTAIVIQVLNEQGVMKTDGGQRVFSVLLFQDIAVIPILALLPLLAFSQGGSTSDHTSLIQGLPGWIQAILTVLAVATVVGTGLYAIRPLFRFIAKARLREVFTAAALMLVIGITLLMSLVGLSPALGTFIAGVVLASSEYRHELEGDIEPFKGLLLGVFFISVGASVNFGLVADNPWRIIALVGVLFAGKFVVLFIVARIFRTGTDHSLLFSFALAQGGEFAFVLFSFATQNNVLPASVSEPLVAVVALSMAATPIQMLLYNRLIRPRVGVKQKPERHEDVIDEENSVIIAGFGRFGNIVGRFLRANGVNATFLDLDADNVEILRKLGIKVFYGDATRLDLLHAAGADKAKLIILAIDDPVKTVEMSEVIREHFPNLTIMARANGRFDAYDLIAAGVDHVYRETLDSSLRLGTDALSLLGFRSYPAHKSAQVFRKRDEAALRELSTLRHDRANYLSVARQRIADLETLLSKDRLYHDDPVDAAWDTTSLREDVTKGSNMKASE